MRMRTGKRLICLLLLLAAAVGMTCGAASAAGGNGRFGDVRESDWFFEPVQYVVSRGIMNGSGANTFAPREKTTRGMLVTMLYRFEGAPAVSSSCPFQDVAAGKYYRNAVIWAAEHQIVGGLGGGRFAPDNAVTREQLAAILYRYAAFKGYDTQGSAALTGFADRASVGSYAVDAMKWAVAEGLLTGVTATMLQPKGFALRSQVAAILMRFCERFTAAQLSLTEPGAEQPDGQNPENPDNTGNTGNTGKPGGNTGTTTPADTPEGFALVVDTVKSAAGDTVQVRISVKDNPGILGMRLTVSYNESAMTLTGAANSSAVSDVLTLTKARTLRSGCKFVWDGVSLEPGDIQDGDVLVLEFQVSGSAAAGSYPVSVTCRSNDIVDNDLQSISPRIQNGSVTIQ